jgi:hypothetical protein
MKAKDAAKPYENCVYYEVHHKKMNRWFTCLIDKTTKGRNTIARAKYVLETSLGRKLKEGYQSHHVNEKTDDDRVENLEEKLRHDHVSDHNKARHPIHCVYLNCTQCGKTFSREMRNYRHKATKQNQQNWFCSRKCLGLHGRACT